MPDDVLPSSKVIVEFTPIDTAGPSSFHMCDIIPRIGERVYPKIHEPRHCGIVVDVHHYFGIDGQTIEVEYRMSSTESRG